MDTNEWFDKVVQRFRDGDLTIYEWNFCVSEERKGNWSAYIMGTGAEQCLARKSGFGSKEEVIELYKSLGVSHILPI